MPLRIQCGGVRPTVILKTPFYEGRKSFVGAVQNRDTSRFAEGHNKIKQKGRKKSSAPERPSCRGGSVNKEEKVTHNRLSRRRK